MGTLEQLHDAVVDGRAAEAVAEATRGLDEGIPAQTLFDEGLMAAMRSVGKLFEEGEVYVPEMLVSAHAMTAALEVLRPWLVQQGGRSSGTVAIGTVKGDLHDIGKNLVSMMLQGSGFEVDDLGADVDSQRFVEAIRTGAEVVALSALLTTTMTGMQEVIGAIRDAGLRERVGIVVGGAPVTQDFADAIGADGYARDASSAVRAVEEVLGRVRAADGRRAPAR
jgi:5-methyltetrahydrofolate--homocysteine methyltransferase